MHIDAFPETPLNAKIVDVHFVNIGFTEAAADKDGFLAAFRAALGPGEFQTLTAEDWAGGPSYITIGAWIGSQTLALALMGLIEFHEVGQVITPAHLRIEGEDANRLAGLGMVMCQVNKSALVEVPAP